MAITQSVHDRIARYVEPVTESGCWLWIGTIEANGYGRLRVGKRKLLAHRVLFSIHRGRLGDTDYLDHLCRVRCCVNPDHLEIVDFRTNVLRGIGPSAKNARKTHCPLGHPYDDTNTHIEHGGGRKCRACDRVAYWNNREKVLAKRKSYAQLHSEQVKARTRAYRARKNAES